MSGIIVSSEYVHVISRPTIQHVCHANASRKSFECLVDLSHLRRGRMKHQILSLGKNNRHFSASDTRLSCGPTGGFISFNINNDAEAFFCRSTLALNSFQLWVGVQHLALAYHIRTPPSSANARHPLHKLRQSILPSKSLPNSTSASHDGATLAKHLVTSLQSM